MAVLTGATVGVKGFVLEMGARVVQRAGMRVAVVSSGYRPGARTVNGSLSLHARRQAIDIAARGAALVRLGQAALAEAGGNSSLTSFAGTVNGWEIIFNSDEPGYGSHYDHLHLGWEGAGVPQGSSGGYSPQAQYGFAELMNLWVMAGGDRSAAAMAAQVASYESGGRPNAHAKTFREDSRGLWQINVKSNAHPEYASANLYDPMVNARAAIAISRNGREWSQWSTAARARSRLATRSAAEKLPSVTRPGGAGGGGGIGGAIGGAIGAIGGAAGSAYRWGDRPLIEILGAGNPLGGISDLINAILWLISPKNWLRMIEFLFGSILLLSGLAILVVEFSKRDTAVGAASRGVVRGVSRFTPTGRLASYYKTSRRRTGGPARRERISNEPTPVYRRPSSQNAGEGGGIPF